MVSHTFPGVAPLVISTDSFDQRLDKAEGGTLYTAGVNQVSPSAANNLVRTKLSNPTGSGVTMRIVKLRLGTATANRIIQGPPVTPATADLTNSVAAVNKQQAGAAGKGKFSYDLTQTASSITTPIDQFRTLAGQTYEFLMGIILPANTEFFITSLDVATTDIMDIFLEWTEK
jgi:hypothetical protein